MDGTRSRKFGKFVNDSTIGNCKLKKVYLEKSVHLCIFSAEDIEYGTELRYNYGDKSLPWRKKVFLHYIVSVEFICKNKKTS